MLQKHGPDRWDRSGRGQERDIEDGKHEQETLPGCETPSNQMSVVDEAKGQVDIQCSVNGPRTRLFIGLQCKVVTRPIKGEMQPE